MLDKTDLKKLIRSRSLRFVRDSRPGAARPGLATYEWNGHTIHFRPGTSDAGLIYNILLKRGRKGEYWVPHGVEPDVVLDIGGNIGISSLYFSARFPRARIYAFEPVAENLALMARNVANSRNVQVAPVALGGRDGTLEMYASDDASNHGGFSARRRDRAGGSGFEVQIRNINGMLGELGIGKVDLIKIDTEGAEYDILTSLDERILRTVQWITGELHGDRDFELLAHLSQWFDIDCRKGLKNRLFNFRACNKTITRAVQMR